MEYENLEYKGDIDVEQCKNMSWQTCMIDRHKNWKTENLIGYK